MGKIVATIVIIVIALGLVFGLVIPIANRTRDFADTKMEEVRDGGTRLENMLR